MLKYSLPSLSSATKVSLKKLQDEVDAQSDRAGKYALATKLFKNKNNKAFDEIRQKLDASGPNDCACYYCERDRRRDIEHIWPKRHYPEYAFSWENYVYACAVCNQDKKRDTFGVINANKLIVFNRTLDFNVNIPTGSPALIDIRTEDPLDFLKLDLETGAFVAVGSTLEQLRGKFTRDLFALNDASLSRVRRQHVGHYKVQLELYLEAKNVTDNDKMDRALTEIKELSYRTVLVEMRRQKDDVVWLSPLIDALPADIGAP